MFLYSCHFLVYQNRRGFVSGVKGLCAGSQVDAVPPIRLLTPLPRAAHCGTVPT